MAAKTTSNARREFRVMLVRLAFFWLWWPALIFVWWVFVSVFLPGVGPVHLGLWRWLDAWYFVGSGWRWQFLGVGAVGTVLIVAVWWANAGAPSTRLATPAAILVVVGITLAVVSLVQFVRAVWDNDKDLARFYGARTTFVVPDPAHPPTAVSVLINDNARGDGKRCDLLGPHGSDVATCIRRGTFSMAGFEPRVGSRDGAIAVMSASSGNIANVRLRVSTLTYLNATKGRPAAWSAIRDGSGIDTPMYGVVEWRGGSERPTQCHFSGKYRIDRAFDGERSNSLPNLLNDRFPRLIFSADDAWGYCAGAEPIVVLPVQRQIHYHARTVAVPAGVVLVRGSSNGGVRLEHRTDVRPGTLPGPVYPDSLVDAQRAAAQWAGGREVRDRRMFGFAPTSSPVQLGNVDDYLLRRVADGRLYWVTPVRPRASDSQQFVAYETVPADTVTDGQLNPLDIAVLADDDPRIVNLDQLVAAATDYIAAANPGLISSGAKLVEFLPVRDDIWQSYVEINGRVVYRLTMSYANRIPTELVALNTPGASTSPTAGRPGAGPGPSPAAGQPGTSPTTACAGPPTSLSDSQLATCIQTWANELAHRHPLTTAPSP
ncbi:hypothetical protein [Frankia canadensis]|nr:hypothetical protein [Frankia canadensis]